MLDLQAECRKCNYKTKVARKDQDLDGGPPLGRCPRCGSFLHVQRKALAFARFYLILLPIALLALVLILRFFYIK